MSHRITLSTIRRSLPTAVALLAAWLLIAPGAARAADERPKELPYDTPTGIPQLDPSYRMTSHKTVLILDQELRPRLVQLEEGQLVTWNSYSKIPSRIVFEREVAKSMVCHSLVNFKIQDDEIRSSDIHAGEFASFCQLKPGRYRYKVVRPDPGSSAASAAKQLEGEIIVGNPSEK
jgi:hypothetical protein